MIDEVGEETTGEEPSTAPIETMDHSIVVETDNAAQEISDVAQNQQEVLTREGSITVHW